MSLNNCLINNKIFTLSYRNLSYGIGKNTQSFDKQLPPKTAHVGSKTNYGIGLISILTVMGLSIAVALGLSIFAFVLMTKQNSTTTSIETLFM